MQPGIERPVSVEGVRPVVGEVSAVDAAGASAELAGCLMEADQVALFGAANRRDEACDAAADDRDLSCAVHASPPIQ